jgi:hypothetical protein
MRVLTSTGFGEVNDSYFEEDTDLVEVTMEDQSDPLGGKQLSLRDDIYDWGDYAVIRVVVVEGNVGFYSNILPFIDRMEAMAFYNAPSPGGETRFLLNLDEGTFQVSRQLGLLAGRYLRISPWLDRWASERRPFEGVEDDEGQGFDLMRSVAEFDITTEARVGTSGGILSDVLLDLDRKKILRFVIFAMVCRGAVFNKRFGC